MPCSTPSRPARERGRVACRSRRRRPRPRRRTAAPRRRRGTRRTCRSRSSRRRRTRRPRRAAARRCQELLAWPRRRSRAGTRARSPGTDAGRPPCRRSSRCVATLVTQSRIASFIASLSVREPDCTACTFAPSSSMRRTFGAWRCTSSAPMNTSQRRPSSAQRRGGRDAVLAGAGLRDDARLAHALGEQHLAERVVDLVRAGVAQVFALEPDRVADLARQVLARSRAASGGRRSRASSCRRRSRTRDRARASISAARARRARASASRRRSARRTDRSGWRVCSWPERHALGHPAAFGKARGLHGLRSCRRRLSRTIPGLHMAKIDLGAAARDRVPRRSWPRRPGLLTRSPPHSRSRTGSYRRLLFALFSAWLWARRLLAVRRDGSSDWLVPGRKLKMAAP